MQITRRDTLPLIGAAALAPMIDQLQQLATAAGGRTVDVATNAYPWITFARRANQQLKMHSDEFLAEIAQTGITGYEPIINDPSALVGLGNRLEKHGLYMRSLYVNSTLHDEARSESSITGVLAIADEAVRIGATIIVTNPSPIRWGGPEDKSDAQLRTQAVALDRLGAELRKRGMMLAYHNHDAELRQGGREFHHMLTATDPENVKLCLDAHWVFRGCGNSEVAVFDALSHYHQRIIELHLRQSNDGVWNESFAATGDIDYLRLFRYLAERDIEPHFVLEQAVEGKSSNDLTAVEAHTKGHSSLMGALS